MTEQEIRRNENGTCEGCYYFKARDFDPEAGKIAFGPFCLKSGSPIRCEAVVNECDLKRKRNRQFNSLKRKR